jgi:hypothetical protein
MDLLSVPRQSNSLTQRFLLLFGLFAAFLGIQNSLADAIIQGGHLK